jgi:hypothetical protein
MGDMVKDATAPVSVGWRFVLPCVLLATVCSPKRMCMIKDDSTRRMVDARKKLVARSPNIEDAGFQQRLRSDPSDYILTHGLCKETEQSKNAEANCALHA